MTNWQQLDEPEKAAESKIWMIVSLVSIALGSLGAALHPESETAIHLARFVALALMAGWYFWSAREQVDFIRVRYGKSYLRRGWSAPLLIAVALMAADFVAIFVVLVMAGDAESPATSLRQPSHPATRE